MRPLVIGDDGAPAGGAWAGAPWGTGARWTGGGCGAGGSSARLKVPAAANAPSTSALSRIRAPRLITTRAWYEVRRAGATRATPGGPEQPALLPRPGVVVRSVRRVR